MSPEVIFLVRICSSHTGPKDNLEIFAGLNILVCIHREIFAGLNILVCIHRQANKIAAI